MAAEAVEAVAAGIYPGLPLRSVCGCVFVFERGKAKRWLCAPSLRAHA